MTGVQTCALPICYKAPLNTTRLYDAVVSEGWEKAQAAYEADKKLNPDSEFLGQMNLSGVGQRLSSNGKSAEAIALMQLVTKEYPASAEAWGNLADALERGGRKQDAIAALRKALEALPNDPMLSASDKKSGIEETNKRIAELSK